MSSITLQKTQFGGRREILVRCYCGEDLFLNISRDDWDGDVEYHFHIGKEPHYLKDRLKNAWRALRGVEYPSTSHVMLSSVQMSELITALEALSSPRGSDE